jgi:hypothetical protein
MSALRANIPGYEAASLHNLFPTRLPGFAAPRAGGTRLRWPRPERIAEADPKRFDLATSWINRRMVDLESRTQRIKEGTHDRIERADKIIDLVRGP